MTLKRIFTVMTAVLLAGMSLHAAYITARLAYRTEGSVPERVEAVRTGADEAISDGLRIRRAGQDYSGLFNRLIGTTYTAGLFRLDNGHITGNMSEADYEPSVEAVRALSGVCEETEVPLLYINIPHKPFSDDDLTAFGRKAAGNLNQDRFLEAIREAGVDTFDLRDVIRRDFENPYDIYYKSDHHWTTDTGLYIAGVVGCEIASRYGLEVETEKFDPKLYKTTVYEDVFLGELGQLTGGLYTGAEDYHLIEPADETHFVYEEPWGDVHREGDFSVMLDKDRLKDPSLYDSELYYTYMFWNAPLQHIENRDSDGPRILIVKDSFGQAVIPFLAMGVGSVDVWDQRGNGGSLFDHIRGNDFDLVIVMYTGSMIGRDIGGYKDPFGFN